MKGSRLLLFFFFPSALVVGLAFLILSPIITQKKPGRLYVGIRFDDEATVGFMGKNAANPLTKLEIYRGAPPLTEDMEPVATHEGLRKGKNIIDTRNLDSGIYSLVFTSPGYEPLIVTAEMRDGEFRETPGANAPSGSKVMDQFIGILMKSESGLKAPH